jgi:hypothetical protein
VQLGDHPGVVLAQGTAPVDQDPQHRELLVVDHRTQTGHPGADQGDRVRVGGVGLAALPGGEHPRPGRELRGHVDDLFAVGEQALGDVPADALATLDRPHPVRPLPAIGQHGVVAVLVGAEPAATEDLLVRGHRLDRC